WLSGPVRPRIWPWTSFSLLPDSARLCLYPIYGLLISAVALGQSGRFESLAPYYPTPEAIVDRMLQIGGLRAGEKMFDLGSGDGRIVILAARKYKADATGIEFESALVKQSMKRIANLGIASTARIIHGDLLKADYSSADLLTVYLLPIAHRK